MPVVAPFGRRQAVFRRAAVVAAAGGPFEELADKLGAHIGFGIELAAQRSAAAPHDWNQSLSPLPYTAEASLNTTANLRSNCTLTLVVRPKTQARCPQAMRCTQT